MMMFATYGHDKVAYAREQMRPAITKLVERAQAAGGAARGLQRRPTSR